MLLLLFQQSFAANGTMTNPPDSIYLFSDYGRWGKEKRLVTPFFY